MKISCRGLYYFFALVALMLGLSACDQNSAANPPALTSGNPSPTAAGMHATPAESAQTAASCPAQTTARAADMPTLSGGAQHANIMYLSQQATGSILQRYDTTNTSIHTILQLPGSATIRGSISPDGQWIVLLSQLQNQAAIQLVRADGQQLQTLYCASPSMSIATALLSPDQRSLVFSEVAQTNAQGSQLYLLDLTNGNLHTLLSPQQAGYPQSTLAAAHQTALVPLSASSHLTPAWNFKAERLQPLAGTHYLNISPVQWINNSSLYVRGSVAGSGFPPTQFYLLRNVKQDITQQQSNLQPVVLSDQLRSCQNYAMTPDAQQLICSVDPGMGGGPLLINMQALNAATAHTVYRAASAGGGLNAYAISNTTLLFIMHSAGKPAALWKVNVDGGQAAALTASVDSNTDFAFANDSFTPWSVCARDGQLYALKVFSRSNQTQALLVGDLNGNPTKTIAAQNSALTLLGWALL